MTRITKGDLRSRKWFMNPDNLEMTALCLERYLNADGGGLALLQTGDRVRIDLGKGTADMLVPLEELNNRARNLAANGGYDMPASQTPWQELFRQKVGRLDHGMTLEGADKYHDIARRFMPRDNH